MIKRKETIILNLLCSGALAHLDIGTHSYGYQYDRGSFSWIRVTENSVFLSMMPKVPA
ncbi:MAG: hypothetical protein NC089_03915 [Bacteroides sp.]|nr:hypothetical protein [Bacteroides sp.]MCM1548540.1 hypothetical protein [Clostridium sp.]